MVPGTPGSAASDAVQHVEAPALQPLAEAEASPTGADEKPSRPDLGPNIIYGIINSIVGIPTMISFASIVYKVC